MIRMALFSFGLYQMGWGDKPALGVVAFAFGCALLFPLFRKKIMRICFWCGDENGEVDAKRYNSTHRETGRKVFVSYNPCPACMKTFSKGIALFEAENHPLRSKKQPELLPGVYPSGRYAVVPEGVVKHFFPDPEEIVKGGKAFVSVEAFEKLMALREEAKKLSEEKPDGATLQ